MDKIDVHVARIGGYSLFHDSVRDVRTLAKFCNILKEKVNELVDQNNKLQQRIGQLEKQLKQPNNGAGIISG